LPLSRVFFFTYLWISQIKSQLSLKIPGKAGSSPWSPKRGPRGERRPFPELFFTHPSGSSVEGPSIQVPRRTPPRERRPVSRNLSYCLSKSTLNEPPLQAPPGPLWRGPFPEPSLHCARSPENKKKSLMKKQNLTFLSMSPMKDPPPVQCSHNGAPFPQSVVYSFIHISQSLQLRSSPWWNDTIWGKRKYSEIS
jgi:hypothetical protein